MKLCVPPFTGRKATSEIITSKSLAFFRLY
jgi:hypothetical protein